MTQEFFVGIDPSLTSSGVIIIDQQGTVIEQKIVQSHKECYINSEQRVYDVFCQLKYVTNILKLKSIYIEGLAYMSASPTLFERCTLLYMLLIEFYKHDLTYKIIPPTTLKKYVTDNGRADKSQMMECVNTRWGYSFDIDDLADAYGLARMALEGK